MDLSKFEEQYIDNEITLRGSIICQNSVLYHSWRVFKGYVYIYQTEKMSSLSQQIN